jgi:hypothetical protein
MGSNQASRDTPAFTLSEVQVGHLPRIREFDIELTSFVKALLSRQLTWSAHESDEPIYVEYLSDICWACKHPVKQVYGHFLNLEDAAGGLLPRAFTVATLSKALESLMLAVSAEELAVLGLNRIERHNVIRGKPTQWPYLNACCHCSAPQDNYFLGQKLVAALHNPDGGGFRVDRVEVRRIVAGKGRWALAITATDSNT